MPDAVPTPTMTIIRTDPLDESSTFDGDTWTCTTTLNFRAFSTPDVSSARFVRSFEWQPYNQHPDDPRQLVKKVDAKLDYKNSGTYHGTTPGPFEGTPCRVWNVTVDFGPWNPLDHSSTGDPDNMPVVARFDSEVAEEIADLDIAGNPIVNAAGEPFDPPVMRDRTRPILIITRNEMSFGDSTILAYADHVNDSTYYKYGPRTLKIGAVRAEPKYDQFTGNYYFRVEYRILYNPETWDSRPLNQGYSELVLVSSGVPATAAPATPPAGIPGTDPIPGVGPSPDEKPEGTYLPDFFDSPYRLQPIYVGGQATPTPCCLTIDGAALRPPVNRDDIIELAFEVYPKLDYTGAFGFPPGLLN